MDAHRLAQQYLFPYLLKVVTAGMAASTLDRAFQLTERLEMFSVLLI
jgi:hypothetical protein